MGKFIEERAYLPEPQADLEPELRLEATSGDERRIRGYAAVFDSPSEVLGWGVREVVRPGAFAKTLQEQDVAALWEHESRLIFARSGTGSLLLEEDERGLRSEATPTRTTWADDMLTQISDDLIYQMSFGFRAVRDEFHKVETDTGSVEVRELLEVQLLDISPVTFPAYPATEVQARAKAAALEARGLSPPAVRAMFSPEIGPKATPAPVVTGRRELKRRRLGLGDLETI